MDMFQLLNKLASLLVFALFWFSLIWEGGLGPGGLCCLFFFFFVLTLVVRSLLYIYIYIYIYMRGPMIFSCICCCVSYFACLNDYCIRGWINLEIMWFSFWLFYLMFQVLPKVLPLPHYACKLNVALLSFLGAYMNIKGLFMNNLFSYLLNFFS